MMLKVKSDRSLKYTVELIEEMMSKLGIEGFATETVDYHMPYESTEELVAKDLIKVILPAGMILDENANIVKADVGALLEDVKSDEEAPAVAEAAPVVVEEAPVVVEEAPAVEEPAVVEEPVAVEETAPVAEEPAVELHVDAIHADELLTDEEAEAKIEIVEAKVKRTGKLVEVNLDTICENYENDETVNIESLQDRRVIGKSAGRIKVLARGVMTKRLTVVADKFSLQAVKMITLAGGHAEIEK